MTRAKSSTSTLPTQLRLGDPPFSVQIDADEKWNRTGLQVQAGQRYTLRADGNWTDGGIPTNPNGFPTDEAPSLGRWLLRMFERKRRVPGENWFRLIGCVGTDERGAFPIGAGPFDWRVPDGVAGELLCFANDVAFAYWNNRGEVVLMVERRE